MPKVITKNPDNVTAMEKMRNVVSWANYQTETFNDKLRSIADIEKAYDYCQQHDELEFLDWQSLNELSQKELNKVVKDLKTILGYNVI